MDPDRCLQEIRLLISQSFKLPHDPPSHHVVIMNYAELSDKVEALDRWLTTGGFIPKVWQRRELVDRQGRKVT